MSLVKTPPKATPQYVPIDVEEMPKLPDSIRELDPEGVSSYENEMIIFLSTIAGSLNSLIDKVEA
tara:strand:+ start:1106 stop:1300 length:195 start_codon:yes stop_codon:yes gene_type:complete